MTDKHKQCITDNFDRLTGSLTVDVLLDGLFAGGIISPSEREELQKGDVKSKRAGNLLSLLLTRQDEAFYVLVNKCKDSCQAHLASLLEAAGKHWCTVI